ncbi:MAG: hypothetical protein COU32_04190 [Candidatus Magasanikbacteria bacterium CG10_big_fil_rev_8_21_14_0_10_42_10]|uniref:Uncharacterized protein n=2 Tax=Candidatus Magasanikiibacteriota TaxID=1752731 RepID=A0A2H0TV55_9BACT|nr:MAG: hypothetical protein COU32_04190 [Candidatus Magasanikbacteria bacterium CG10_big_fil_rev_8_21_14_0_10_42_10]PIZ93663.1 MAG: hypothetical protein COX82_02220 [Candidatus Magasanikbacteria bacterium CG_4_10_14_0_2_um_filter_41_10]
MKKNILILLTIGFSLVTLGIGCKKADINNSTEDTLSFRERNEQMYVSVAIMPGVKVVTTTVATKIATNNATKTPTTTVETEDYGAAFAIYGKSGYRLQFSACSGNPGYMTMKRGVKFMIDNRDNERHDIAIGTNTYTLEAYDFAIVSIQKAGDFAITCDGGGAAHVLIQN